MIHEEDEKIETKIKNLIDQVLDDEFSENTFSTLTLNETEQTNQSESRKNKTATNIYNVNVQTTNTQIKSPNIENLKRGSLFIPQSNLIFKRDPLFQDISQFDSNNHLRHSAFNFHSLELNNLNFVGNDISRRGSASSFLSNGDSEFYEFILSLHEINYENFNLISGKIVKMLTNQRLSRVLQRCLTHTDNELKEKILYEILNHIPELMCTSYANYFISNFYLSLQINGRIKLLESISGHLKSIGINKTGTYPLQIIIENVKSTEEKKVLLEILRNNPFLTEMVYDQNGVHVVEKLFNCIDEEFMSDFYELIYINFLKIANDPHGVSMAKKVIILAKNKEYIIKIQQLLLENTLPLIQSTFGNYVIQVSIENWNKSLVMPIIQKLYGKLYDLSFEQCSSQIIERCLEKGGEPVISQFIQEFINKRAYELMKSKYGNYVVQKVLTLSEGNNRKILLSCLLKNIEKVGEKLSIKWKSIVFPYLNENLPRKSFLYNNNNLNIYYNSSKMNKVPVKKNSVFSQINQLNFIEILDEKHMKNSDKSKNDK